MPNPIECILSLAVAFSFLLGISFLFNVTYVIKRGFDEPKKVKKPTPKTRPPKSGRDLTVQKSADFTQRKPSSQASKAFMRKKPQIALKETVRSPEEFKRYLKN